MTVALVTRGMICPPQELVACESPRVEVQGEVKPVIISVEEDPVPDGYRPIIVGAEEQ